MGMWTRLMGRQAPVTKVEAGEESLLIISDIHLGEDVLADGPDSLAENIRALNREIGEFVAAHRQRHPEGRRWHLIINGDMFDFVKVSLKPDPEEAFQTWSRMTPRPGSRSLNTPDAVAWKLERIFEIHRPFFKELGAFLLAGHRITIIEGNHDAEFYFPEVQSAMREVIVKEAEKIHRQRAKTKRGNPGEELDAEALAAAINFRAWFEANPGRYHIEHGHQYDEFCSFEYNLAPVNRSVAPTIATPMSHRLMPYFVEILGDFSTHGIGERAFGWWMKYVFSCGPRMIYALFSTYVVAMWQLLSQAGKKRKVEIDGLAASHENRLEALTRESPYGLETLQHLDELKATPAEFSVGKMMRVFYLDRFVTIFSMLLLVIVAFILGGRMGIVVGATSVMTGVVLMVAFARTRQTDLPETLRWAAVQIADQTGARYVVFGHSHQPELVNLKERYGVGRFGESAFYLNSGSWVTREVLLGEEGEGMTYVEISRHGAFLKRWRGDVREPIILASTHHKELFGSAQDSKDAPASSEGKTG